LNWRDHIREDPQLRRPAEVDHLVGDASTARRVLGWKPEVSLRQLVGMMVDADMAAYAQLLTASASKAESRGAPKGCPPT
jgi:GDPmannose 4,6-dehydratase